MARRSSHIPLKRRKPRWYCVNRYYGAVQNLASYPKPLYYITDPREIKVIKRMLGNPEFFKAYDYLLVTRDDFGEFDEVFGITAPVRTNGFKDITAFTGAVDRVMWGWAPDKRHYDAIIEEGDEPEEHQAVAHVPASCVNESGCLEDEVD